MNIHELMQYPLFGGLCFVLWRLLIKVESIGIRVAVLEERDHVKEVEAYCKPVREHEAGFHGKVHSV